ncbi:hypothetical protein ACEZCY_15350 [Streptacidiphilus sp. N1-12]|uniref:Uncharacterized protein n=2 Tax=Streptacidiphilus alkalitolerans TaxID=3342712 RepID=A0ABV6WF19_9ACTN
MTTRRPRPDRPAPLPGTAHLRLVTGDPDTEEKVLNVLRAYFTITEPAHYPGGRAYLQLDTRTPHPTHPEAD